jgi:hypothetical protein
MHYLQEKRPTAVRIPNNDVAIGKCIYIFVDTQRARDCATLVPKSVKTSGWQVFPADGSSNLINYETPN